MSCNHLSAIEYQLIDISGECHGGFISLSAAREYARAEQLSGWDIWRMEYHPHSVKAANSARVELHNPDDPAAPRVSWNWAQPVPLPIIMLPEALLTAAEEALAEAERIEDARVLALLAHEARTYVTLAAAAAKMIREAQRDGR